MEEQSNRIWRGAVLLTISMFIVKILSVAYRIPYQNITGNTGFYVFQQVYPFYGIASTFALTGLPVALSRVLSEKAGNSSQKEMARIIQSALVAFSAVGFLLFLILLFGADTIASLMGDHGLKLPIQATSFIYLVVPVVAVFRGGFQGFEQMKPTAISQVIEQSVRVACIIGASYYLISRGYDVYVAGAGATLGAVVGSCAGILVLALYLYKTGIRLTAFTIWQRPSKNVALPLLSAGLLLSVSSMILIMFQLADAFTFVNVLRDNGILLDEARSIKGVFDRAQPLLQLGTVIATSLSLAAVPAIAAARKRQDNSAVRRICGLSLKTVFIIGLSASAGLAVIIEPTNRMLFKSGEGSLEIAVLGISILFVSLFLTSTGLLQGIGYSTYPVFSVCIAFAVKVAGNALLMPNLEAVGASLATVFAAAVAAGLNLVLLEKKTGFAAEGKFHGVRIAAAVAAMSLAAWLVKAGLTNVLPASSRLSDAVVALGASIGGGVILLFALVLLKIYRIEETVSIPKIQKIQLAMKRWKERRS